MIQITKGDLPKLTDTLKVDGTAVDLTGATVQFVAQSGATNISGTATIVTALSGIVEYTLTSGQTDVLGLYRGQWVVTKAGVTSHFPSVPFQFEILDAIPEITSAITPLTECYDLVRAILGDLHPEHQRYQDESIDKVLRTVVRLGRVPGYALTPNQRGIAPAVADSRSLGLLTYHAAKMFLMPNVAAYSYRLRAASESFGDQTRFLFELENVLFDLTNGDGGVFTTFQSFYGWVNSLTGMNLWQSLTELKTNAPVATATIGRDGLQVTNV